MKSANRRQTYGYQRDITVDVEYETPPPLGRWTRDWIHNGFARKEIEEFALESMQADVKRWERIYEANPTPAAENWLKFSRGKLADLEAWNAKYRMQTRRVAAAAE